MTDVKIELLMIHSNTCNHLTVCKENYSCGRFETVYLYAK